MINVKEYQQKYHYFYKITNTVNNKFYYGVHSTSNLDDGYMGSGTIIKKAIKKYGVDKFIKEILKYFNSSAEKFQYEKEFITKQLLQDPLCYNIIEGGSTFPEGYFKVKDKNGNISIVTKDNPGYISGELVGLNTGKTCVRDKNNNRFLISVDDPRYLSGDVINIHKDKIIVFDKLENKNKQIDIDEFYSNRDNYMLFSDNKVVVKDSNGNTMQVSMDDPRYLSGELTHISCGTASVKDKDGNTMKVAVNDPRYLSGELISTSCGQVTVKDKDGNTMKVAVNDPRYLSGELVGATYNYKTYLDSNNKIRRGVDVATQHNTTFSTYIDSMHNVIYTHSNDARVLSGEYKLFFKDKVPVRDENGDVMLIDKNDSRYMSGELHHMHKNEVTVRDNNFKCFNVKINDPRLISGELVRAVTDYITMYKDSDENQYKQIHESKIPEYYSKGYRFKYICSNNTKYKSLFEFEIDGNWKICTSQPSIKRIQLLQKYNLPLPDKSKWSPTLLGKIFISKDDISCRLKVFNTTTNKYLFICKEQLSEIYMQGYEFKFVCNDTTTWKSHTCFYHEFKPHYNVANNIYNINKLKLLKEYMLPMPDIRYFSDKFKQKLIQLNLY